MAAPTFPQLVDEAQVIARGKVTFITSRWADAAGQRVIKTFVTFAVEKSLKGTPPNEMTLEFLGGTVGGDALHVSGMPQFAVGESEILFVNGNGVQFCPLVRMMHGRYHVRHDAAANRHYVTRDDDTPLTSTDDVQLPAEQHAAAKTMRAATPALTRDEFETQVTAEVARRSR